MKCDYLIVGAGFFGCVLAERIANDLKKSVLIIDKRNHIGGNCYSLLDAQTQIEYHLYGTHIFHTSSEEAWKYITRFTEFNGYHHQVLTKYRGKIYQMPINLETINTFYGLNLTPQEARDFINSETAKEKIPEPRNFEEMAISQIGRPLYEAFIKHYTRKQWNKDPKEVPAKIFSRLPVRFNYSEDYFKNARWQGIPLDGYGKMFERILNSSQSIQLQLGCDYFLHKEEFEVKYKTIYTGPIDRLFDYRFGKLEWRSVRFERRIADVEDFQGNSVMNLADPETDFTRIHEPRHLHPEREYSKNKTLLFYETPMDCDEEPYYPVNSKESQEIFRQYTKLVESQKNLIVGGRLGNYVYNDMDKTILAALKCYQEQILKV